MEELAFVFWLLFFPLFEELGMYLRYKRGAKVKFSDNVEMFGIIIYYVLYVGIASLLFHNF